LTDPGDAFFSKSRKSVEERFQLSGRYYLLIAMQQKMAGRFGRNGAHMISNCTKALATCAAALLASAAGVTPGSAQGYGPQGGYSEPAPPAGSYAEPPPGAAEGSAYDDQTQAQDDAYADAYSRWAAQYCVNQANNAAAGAVIGGILGAGIGAAVSHNAGRGALVGGAIGVGTGAVAGAASTPGGCPPGYVIAGGAPAFAYAGGPYVAYAPGWYRPWVWAGGRWVYHPYRRWYWGHRNYWHPGWHARPVRWRHPHRW
jgi:hypothetical protein